MWVGGWRGRRRGEGNFLLPSRPLAAVGRAGRAGRAASPSSDSIASPCYAVRPVRVLTESAAVSVSILLRRPTETWSKTILPSFLKRPRAGDSSGEEKVLGSS